MSSSKGESGSDGENSSGDATESDSKSLFSEGEKVQKAEYRKNEWRYFVHYLDNPATEKFIKIQIPPNLKKQLVDDWEFVTQQNKLVKLPRSPSVDDILTKYLEYRSKKDGKMIDAVGEILNGIRCYFDKALPTILLYKKERQQYREAIQDNISPSSIYGAEHLLRLFVKLPELLAYVKVEEETLLRMQQKLLEFLKFLQNNESTFFLSSYDGPKVTEGSGKGKD
ncbi:hypothetical protein DH2020_012394 [Rehmannia glutinosa]|uniref:MRG domain-containing protein n=1 Tax=Rehmannia glutinosa TaxID=99300 RepID=A0ABR0X2S2_REHGL